MINERPILRVSIAETPSDLSHGLMFRKSLADDSGMVFLFRRPDNLRFWGANTYIPLDIAFINPHNRITQISHIKPLCEKPVTSEEKCHMAIEANFGFFEKNRIKIGDKVVLERDAEESNIKFVKAMKSAQQSLNQNPMPQAIEQAKPQEVQPPLPTLTPEQIMEALEDSFDEQEYKEKLPTEEVPEEPQIPEEPEIEEEPVPVPEEEFPDFATPQQALLWAQQNHQVVHIWYTTKGGRDIEREIEPHGLFTAKSTGNQILVTFDETVGSIRAFILNNVLFHQFVGKEFQPKFVVEP
jgi:uncharacterized membrane protein (UPF0127 family)